MQVKSCLAEVKAVGDPKDGQFEAIVSVFGNKDSYGDVVLKGAFADTLAEWKASGNPIPVLYSHRSDDPDYNIGHVIEAKETDKGLWVKAQLDIEDPAPGSKAPQVYKLLKSGRLAQFSFAYEIQDAAMAKSEELGDYYELRKLKLYEVGPTPIGANQATELLSVKAIADGMTLDIKAGRAISAKNETELRKAYDAIGVVLAALGDSEPEKTSGTLPVTKDDEQLVAKSQDDEPPAAKSEAPAATPSVDAWAAQLTLIELEGTHNV